MGEKIDVISWVEDEAEFIAKALAPANVLKVDILQNDEEARVCRVTVPDDQLSLAIGNKGQNAKLAAGLTGFKIDIVSDKEPIPEPEEEELPEEETAEDIISEEGEE